MWIFHPEVSILKPERIADDSDAVNEQPSICRNLAVRADTDKVTDVFGDQV